jgi:probable phosphoglycerate mutase
MVHGMAMKATEKWTRPVRRRIYLLRHGDVSYFDPRGQPYHPNTVPLNADGRAQAEAAGRALADVPIDRVVSSNLTRSAETAQIVAAGRNLQVEERPELREIQPGRLAEIASADLEAAFVGAFGKTIDRETRFLAGETFGSLIDRVVPCFRDLLAQPNWRHLLVVAHGGVNRTVIALALRVELNGFGALEQDPACINILDVDDRGELLIRMVNYTPYNHAKTGMDLTTMERLYLQFRAPKE